MNYDPAGNVTDVYTSQASSGNPRTCAGQTGGAHLTNRYQGDPGISCGAKTGELCSTLDAKSNVTSYSFDASGNVTRITPPSPLGATIVVPDNLSRTSSVTDGKGQKTTYCYDKVDRLVKLFFGASSA